MVGAYLLQSFWQFSDYLEDAADDPLFSSCTFFQHLFNREYGLRAYHGLALLVTVAVLAFYVWRTNNYGGGAQGLRWTFWLIPLWLVALPRGVETVLRSRVGAVIAMGFLGVSVFSMAFALTPSTGPWSQSWLHYVLKQVDLVAY